MTPKDISISKTKEAQLKSNDAVKKETKEQQYTFTNWAGNQRACPAQIFHPQTANELVDIVHLANVEGKKIRCTAFGCTWSSSSVVNEEGYLVNITKMNRIFDPVHVEGNGWTVEIEAGVAVKDLDDALRKHEPPLALTSSVVLNSISFGGIISLGCHGAASHESTMSDLVTKVKIIDASGVMNTFSKAADPHEFSAAAVSLGLLGITYSYTIRVEPMFKLRMRDSSPPLVYYFGSPKTCGPRLKAMVLGNDQTEIFYWPFHANGKGMEYERIWLKEWQRTSLPCSGSRTEAKIKKWAENIGMKLGNTIYRVMLQRPSIAPLVIRTLYKAINMNKERVLYAPDAIHYQSGIEHVQSVCTEMGIKADENFENVIHAWNKVIELIEVYQRKGSFPLNIAVEMRFVKASQMLMSNLYDTDPNAIYAAIEIITASDTSDFEHFATEISQYWMDNFKAQ
ncbi:hypothetical protein BX616_006922 [Lobosporangium transversale]|nr:hypothetical protein BX616_006922 [Lobosporangium transversale]